MIIETDSNKFTNFKLVYESQQKDGKKIKIKINFNDYVTYNENNISYTINIDQFIENEKISIYDFYFNKDNTFYNNDNEEIKNIDIYNLPNNITKIIYSESIKLNEINFNNVEYLSYSGYYLNIKDIDWKNIINLELLCSVEDKIYIPTLKNCPRKIKIKLLYFEDGLPYYLGDLNIYNIKNHKSARK